MQKTLNVVFDLGGVLFDWNPQKVLEAFFPGQALCARMMQAIYRHPDWAALDRGVLSEADMLDRLVTRTGVDHRLLQEILQATRASLLPLENSWALVEQLHRQQIPLYVISNMPLSTWLHLQQHHPRWHYFHGILISAELGMVKPEKPIFESLLSRYQLQAGDTLFIDDAEENVRAARQAGLQGMLFTNAKDCARHLRQQYQTLAE
jgi:putative hydrolase of the HAD superfamily